MIAMIRFLGVLAFAVGAGASCGQSPIDPSIKTADVKVGDVIVHLQGRDRPREAEGVYVDPEKDPRFHYVKPLKVLVLAIHRRTSNDDRLPTSYERRLKGVAPFPPDDPAFDRAFTSMSVFPQPSGIGDFVRIDGTEFFGQPVYVWHRPGRLAIIETLLTPKVTVHVTFQESDHPPWEWRDFLKALETGIKDMVSFEAPPPE